MMLASMAERKQPRMPLACKGTKKKRNVKEKDRNLSQFPPYKYYNDNSLFLLILFNKTLSLGLII